MNDMQSVLSRGISVPNAGLVMLQTYFKILFEKLGVVSGNEFTSLENQVKAVHYLQYIVTGFTKTEESLLLLNKVLCGLDPTSPITDGIDITDEQKELINGMISSAISYWTAIGESSIDGFRGNWFVRDGILFEKEDRWKLHVENKSYDILINQSPFSFSIIKFPWMKKALHVQWTY